MKPIAVSTLLVVTWAAFTFDAAAAVQIASSRYEIGAKSPGSFVPYLSSHPLAEPNERITRVLFSIHSSGFDADQYFENARIAASKVPGAIEETLIIAPQLFEQKAIPGTAPPGMLFWRVSPFRGSSQGAVGPEAKQVSISPFDVMDAWLKDVVDSKRYPKLKDIVLVGHSGGGQFVQRYAMVGKYEPSDPVRCRYVVSAPSSYAYPTAERYDPQKKGFIMPDAKQIATCPSYNGWGYGLASPYAYFSDLSAEEIAKRYATRDVFYLCGANDRDPNDDTIGTSCGAMTQGRHRLERMQIFAKLLEHAYGPSIKNRHRFAVVNGVGHWGQGTMTSSSGLKALFGPL